jgi:hypothetical protein
MRADINAPEATLRILVGTGPALLGGFSGALHEEAARPPAVYQTAEPSPDPYSGRPLPGLFDRLSRRQRAAVELIQEAAG